MLMSRLDDLRAAAANIDPQFQVSSNEIPGVLSALVYYQEHGDALLEAEDVEAVTELLAPAPAETEGQAAAPASAPDLSDEELAARISDLQAQQASRQATSQQTQVEHQEGEE